MLKISREAVDSLNDKLNPHKNGLISVVKPLLHWRVFLKKPLSLHTTMLHYFLLTL